MWSGLKRERRSKTCENKAAGVSLNSFRSPSVDWQVQGHGVDSLMDKLHKKWNLKPAVADSY